MVSAAKRGALAFFAILAILLSAYQISAAKSFTKASSEIEANEITNGASFETSDSNFEQTLSSCKNVNGPQKNYIRAGNPLVTGQAILLMENKQDDFEKLKAAFEFASNEISYLVYDNWRYPEEVLETRNGDCTDKSILLVSMLKNQGIDSYVVYGKEVNDYSHAWVAAKVDGKWVQVDPTAGDLNYFYTCSGNSSCEHYEHYKIAGMFNEDEVLKCES